MGTHQGVGGKQPCVFHPASLLQAVTHFTMCSNNGTARGTTGHPQDVAEGHPQGPSICLGRGEGWRESSCKNLKLKKETLNSNKIQEPAFAGPRGGHRPSPGGLDGLWGQLSLAYSWVSAQWELVLSSPNPGETTWEGFALISAPAELWKPCQHTGAAPAPESWHSAMREASMCRPSWQPEEHSPLPAGQRT